MYNKINLRYQSVAAFEYDVLNHHLLSGRLAQLRAIGTPVPILLLVSVFVLFDALEKSKLRHSSSLSSVI